MITLSIVVPVYNARGTILRCLDSILSQRVELEYEVVVVDDGSTDGTSELLAHLLDSEVDSGVLEQCTEVSKEVRGQNGGYWHVLRRRVRCCSLPANQGVSAARNAGVACATGRYLWFVDGDDFVARGALDALGVVLATHAGADIVRFQWKEVYEVPQSYDLGNPVPSRLEVVDVSNGDEAGLLHCFAQSLLCNAVFRAEVVGSVRFRAFTHGEDRLFATEALLNASTVVLCECPWYGYVRGHVSASRERGDRKFRSYLGVTECIVRSICGSGLPDDRKRMLVSAATRVLYPRVFTAFGRRDITMPMWEAFFECYKSVLVDCRLRSRWRRLWSWCVWRARSPWLCYRMYDLQRGQGWLKARVSNAHEALTRSR